MGFGYLLLGYLIAFLLKILASGLGIGGVALLFGYVVMWYGISRLKLFCSSFVWAEWSMLPLLLIAVYRVLQDFAALFLWNMPWLSGNVASVAAWADLLLIVLMHAALLSSIRELAMGLELKHITVASMRNMILVGFYAFLYFFYQLPIGSLDGIKPYLGPTMTLLNLIWLILNLWLFLTCTKDICAEGDEEIAPRRYRWELLNRIGDRFGENIQKAGDRNKEEIEQYLRRRNDKRAQQARDADQGNKQYHHQKRKKKK